MAALIAVAVAWPLDARAQDPDPDRIVNPARPDFTLVSLPTTLRVPRHKAAFRVTHRFGRPLGQGDFGDLLENFFGLDSGAQIGLEYRFGLISGGQVGIHRTSNRTIEFFGQYDLVRQTNTDPLGVAVIATVEGTNNFRDHYTPALGAVVSYALGTHGAVFIDPMWVHDANLFPSPLLGTEINTFLVGLGARLRVRPTVYLVGEISPRVSGYSPGTHQGSFAIEKRAGGHVFQLNFSNGFGTTIGQVTRGGTGSDDWYLGFNISRKFF